MQKKTGNFIVTGIWVILFILFTVLIQIVDVHTIGPKSSSVGFASINGPIHEFLGVHTLWYSITYWLGFVPLSTAGIFAAVGLKQLIQRKSLLKVDKSIIALGVFYTAVILVYRELQADSHRRISGSIVSFFPYHAGVLFYGRRNAGMRLTGEEQKNKRHRQGGFHHHHGSDGNRQAGFRRTLVYGYYRRPVNQRRADYGIVFCFIDASGKTHKKGQAETCIVY